VKTVEAILSAPVSWVASQLAQLPVSPLRRALVLVGAERQAHAIRRHICVELGQPQLLAGVLLTRPVELAREIVARSGRMLMPDWEDVRRLRILQLFESATLAHELRYFNADQLRSGQGYVDAFARTIADLEASGLDVALARTAAQQLERRDPLAADRLHDVAAVWQAADAGESTLTTTPRLLGEAAEVVAAHPEIVAPFGRILVVLTAAPSTALLRFLRALPECHAVLQEARPLREGTQRWRALLQVPAPAPTSPADSELGLVQRFLFQPPEILTDPQRARSRGPDGTVDLEEHPSIEEEVEAAATWVTEQIAAGTPAEQIALIVPEIDPYATFLTDRLARVSLGPNQPGLRAHVAGGLSVAASPAGLRILGVLNALARGLEAEATIRILPALRRGQQGNEEGRERLTPSRAAEIVYGAGIVGGSPGDRAGLTEWLPCLQRRRDALRALVDEAACGDAADVDRNGSNADEPEKHLDVRTRHQAERWLRDVEPILPAIAALQQLGEAVLADAALSVVWLELRRFVTRWVRVPPDPPNLLARLEQSMQSVLAHPVAAEIGGAAAVRFLIDVLHRERRPTGRFGEPCIFIGTSAQAAGIPFAAVRVLGLAEGALPHTPHDDPIVPDSLRVHIEEAARAQQRVPDVVLPRLSDRVLDDIHDAFRVISATGERLALSAPRQWVDRSEREVSGIMLEVATALGRPGEDGSGEGDVPTSARLRAAYLNCGRAARRGHAHSTPLSPRAALTAGAVLASPAAPALNVPAAWARGDALSVDRLWRLTSELQSTEFSGVDGVVSEAWRSVLPLGLVPERPISATALTMLLSCPHRFMLERVLYLSEPARRPSTDVISPIIYGSLFHAAAERFFREAGAAICRHEGTLEHWVARARAIAGEQFEALRYEYPMRGEDGIARERERLLRQIEQLVQYEWQLARREYLASELPFGEPAAVRLEVDGGALYVRGAIDRIDRLGPESLSVRDLKTGRVRDFGEDPINAARDLQIGLYVLAVEAAGYGAAPVGAAAYVHPSAAQEPDRAFTGRELDLLRRQTREWLSIARQLLSAGTFPRTPNPEDCTYCPFLAACGEGAHERSAAKLNALPADHPLERFARFKRRRSEDEG
jgi:RecB family exonuclease